MSSMTVARTFSANSRCVIWSDGTVEDQTIHDWLESKHLPAQAHQIGAAGRGSAWQLPWSGGDLALRHYRRGGLIAKMSRDLYVWLGAEQSRCGSEFNIMTHLCEQGLLVPKPVAAIACRVAWVFYRAALVTRWVDHVGSLASQVDPDAWRAAGVSIARLHAQGIWHADLNVHNILIDGRQQAWIIDFDRARQGIRDRRVLRRNLERLLRSVHKVCPDRKADCWPILLEGYEQTSSSI